MAINSLLRRLTPKGIKNYIKSSINPFNLHSPYWQQKYNEVINNARVPKETVRTAHNVCIVKDVMMRHSYYEAACIELGIPYDLLDVSSNKWIDQVINNNYQLIFVRPFVLSGYGKKYYDEIIYILDSQLKSNIYPNKNDLWIYESKTRCAYDLIINKIPHPKTYIFNDLEKALSFVKDTSYPLIFKTDIGSDASGVRLLSTAAEAKKLVNKCFSKGFTSYFFDSNDRQLGTVIFQEYLKNVREIRVIRIGDSYFVYEKGKKGNFHSGSKIVYYIEPSIELLNFVKTLTDKIASDCMSVDVFVNDAGNFYVNELQTYYGANEPGGIYFENSQQIFLEQGQTHEMRINGRNGRFCYKDRNWLFEEGDFARNAGANLRVVHAFQKLGISIADYKA